MHFFFPLHLFKVPVNEEIIYRVKLKEKSQENAMGFAIELEKRILILSENPMRVCISIGNPNAFFFPKSKNIAVL